MSPIEKMNTFFERDERGAAELCVCRVCFLDFICLQTEAHAHTGTHFYSIHCQCNKNPTVTLSMHSSSHHELRIRGEKNEIRSIRVRLFAKCVCVVPCLTVWALLSLILIKYKFFLSPQPTSRLLLLTLHRHADLATSHPVASQPLHWSLISKAQKLSLTEPTEPLRFITAKSNRLQTVPEWFKALVKGALNNTFFPVPWQSNIYLQMWRRSLTLSLHFQLDKDRRQWWVLQTSNCCILKFSLGLQRVCDPNSTCVH